MLKIVKKPRRFFRVLVKDAEGKLLGEDYTSSFTEEAVLKKARKKYGHVDLRVEPTTLRMVLLYLWGKTKETAEIPFPDADDFTIKQRLGLPHGWGEEEEVNRRLYFNQR